MDEAYRAGNIRRWEISNFSPGQVEELMGVVERKGEFSLPLFLFLFVKVRANPWLISNRIREAERASGPL
jgi:aryl-alcohol dehydrogenase-like predicted oxidoreductase